MFSGLLSTSGGVFGNALLRTDVTSSKNRADIQLTFSAIADDLGKEDNGENDKNVREIKVLLTKLKPEQRKVYCKKIEIF